MPMTVAKRLMGVRRIEGGARIETDDWHLEIKNIKHLVPPINLGEFLLSVRAAIDDGTVLFKLGDAQNKTVPIVRNETEILLPFASEKEIGYHHFTPRGPKKYTTARIACKASVRLEDTTAIVECAGKNLKIDALTGRVIEPKTYRNEWPFNTITEKKIARL